MSYTQTRICTFETFLVLSFLCAQGHQCFMLLLAHTHKHRHDSKTLRQAKQNELSRQANLRELHTHTNIGGSTTGEAERTQGAPKAHQHRSNIPL